VQRLFGIVEPYLPEQAWLYEEDALTDRSDKFLASELIREKLFRLTGDELPYSCTVVIDKYEEEGNLRRIAATIVVERDAHKGMVIGDGGERLKRIGSETRQELEKLTDARSSWSCGSRCARAGPTTRSTCAATATNEPWPAAGPPRSSAFVLHQWDWSETSLILDLFTREQGRVAVAAKGAKRPIRSCGRC
jgi:hypothetical protein